MKTTTAKAMLKTFATRTVVAAIPVAMVSAAFASNGLPTPPRLAEYAIQTVAEINVAPTTVGIAASPLTGQSAAEIGAQLDDMLAIGVTNIRVLVPWYNIEFLGPDVDPNTYPGSALWQNMDTLMTEAAKRNMGVLADITSTPPYAVQNGLPGSGTPDPDAYAAFLKKFIAKTITVNGTTTTYGDIVSAYEIWNEPNYLVSSGPVDPEAYAQLLAKAYAAIKTGAVSDPTATVVAGAVGTVQSSPFTLNTVEYVQRVLAELNRLGASNSFDALSVHPYSQEIEYSDSCPTCAPGLLTPREQVDALKALIGGKLVWITEYGVPTYDPPPYVGLNGQVVDPPPFTEAQQSAWIKDLLDYWKANPEQAGPIFLYTGQDSATAIPSVDEGNYGLFNADGTPKTAAQMLKEWLAAQNPTDPSNPTNPPNPADAIAKFFAVLAQQLAQVAQVFAQLQAVQVFFQAVANWLGSFGAPAAAAPVALRMAGLESSETEGLVAGLAAAPTAADEAKVADTASAKDGKVTEATGAVVDTAAVVATPEAAATVSGVSEVLPASPMVAEVKGTVTTASEVTAPVAGETPTTTEPAVTKPADTTPAATTPAASGVGEGTADSPTTPASTDKSGTDKSGTDKSGTDKPDKSDSDKPDKSGADKPAADKSGSDKSGSDKSGTDKPAADKSGSDKSGSDKSGATPRGKWKIRHAKGDKPSADASSADSSTPAVAK